ncbi:MAG: hypothetical protein ABIT09_05115 [Croceibacterium sp.]
MFTRKILASVVAAGLVLGSTAAAAAPSAINGERAASPVDSADGLRGGWAWILALLIVIGVIAVIASDNNETLPRSP